MSTPSRASFRSSAATPASDASDFAAEAAIERQCAAAVDQDRQADQQQIKRQLHAASVPGPEDRDMMVDGGHDHEAGEQRRHRRGQEAEKEANPADEFEATDVIGPEQC